MSFLCSLCKEVVTFKVIIWFGRLCHYYLIDVFYNKVQSWQFFIFYCSPATGYAQMTSPIGKDKSPEFGSSSLSGVFSVEWMKKYADLQLIFKFKGQNVNNDLG